MKTFKALLWPIYITCHYVKCRKMYNKNSWLFLVLGITGIVALAVLLTLEFIFPYDNYRLLNAIASRVSFPIYAFGMIIAFGHFHKLYGKKAVNDLKRKLFG